MARKDLEQRLMRRLVDGVAAWATFHQAGHPVAHYDEHLFYPPIREIAEGRRWTAKQHQSIIRASAANGAPETIDFVIFRKAGSGSKRSALVFVEVKYFRGKKPSQDIKYLRNDINKLSSIATSDLECAQLIADCSEPARFLLIVARGEQLDATIACKSRKHAGVSKMLRRARDKQLATVYKSTATNYLKTAHQWRAIAIGSPQWPE